MEAFRSFADRLNGTFGRTSCRKAGRGLSKNLNGILICKDGPREAGLNGHGCSGSRVRISSGIFERLSSVRTGGVSDGVCPFSVFLGLFRMVFRHWFLNGFGVPVNVVETEHAI
jgi:hypothetical protein